MKWIQLTNHEQLESIVEESEENTVLIFKHSTRCGISRMALRQFENDFDYESGIIAYFLDLLQYRDISNTIASRFGVQHQSPQLIVIKNGKSVYNASHDSIDAGMVGDFVD